MLLTQNRICDIYRTAAHGAIPMHCLDEHSKLPGPGYIGE